MNNGFCRTPVKRTLQFKSPMEIVRLEELGPELLFTQLGRHILNVFLFHGRVRLEYGLDDVWGEIVLQPVCPVRLGLDLS